MLMLLHRSKASFTDTNEPMRRGAGTEGQSTGREGIHSATRPVAGGGWVGADVKAVAKGIVHPTTPYNSAAHLQAAAESTEISLSPLAFDSEDDDMPVTVADGLADLTFDI